MPQSKMVSWNLIRSIKSKNRYLFLHKRVQVRKKVSSDTILLFGRQHNALGITNKGSRTCKVPNLENKGNETTMNNPHANLELLLRFQLFKLVTYSIEIS